MSRVTASTDFDKVDAKDLPRYLTLFAQDVAKQLSNGIDFQTNFNAAEVSVTFSAANTDTPVHHGLGRVTSRYVVTSASAAMSVYTGATPGQANLTYLRSSATGTATVLIY